MNAKDTSNPQDQDLFRMDKNTLSVTTLFEKSDNKEYWLSKTPQDRLEAVELMRQINYGYNPVNARLQRVLEIAEFTSD